MFILVVGWLVDIAKRGDFFFENQGQFWPIGVAVLWGLVTGVAAATAVVPARVLNGGRPAFWAAYLSHLAGMILFTVAVFAQGGLWLGFLSFLLVIGAVGTLVFGGRQLENAPRLILVGTALILLSFLADAVLEVFEPPSGYVTYVGRLVLAGVVTWLALMAVASGSGRPISTERLERA